MEWEIGLCAYESGPASEIVGPFLSRDAAANASMERNKEQKRRNWPKWMWARKDEITRGQNCIDRVNS